MKLAPIFLVCTLLAADQRLLGSHYFSAKPTVEKRNIVADISMETTAKNWLQNRYHAPSDDLNQPVDTAAAAKFNRILLDLGTRSPMQRIGRSGARTVFSGDLRRGIIEGNAHVGPHAYAWRFSFGAAMPHKGNHDVN
jgi:hypothetical protein